MIEVLLGHFCLERTETKFCRRTLGVWRGADGVCWAHQDGQCGGCCAPTAAATPEQRNPVHHRPPPALLGQGGEWLPAGFIAPQEHRCHWEKVREDWGQKGDKKPDQKRVLLRSNESHFSLFQLFFNWLHWWLNLLMVDLWFLELIYYDYNSHDQTSNHTNQHETVWTCR